MAEADIVVFPGLKVEVKSATAKVSPLRMVMDESTVPIYIREEESPIVMSCNALNGFPILSCN